MKMPRNSGERIRAKKTKFSPPYFQALHMEKVPDDSIVAPKHIRIYSGRCDQGICGSEAACTPTEDGKSHYCICPHDSTQPTDDLKCPNRLRVPQTSKPILNVIPPSAFNSSASAVPPLASIKTPVVQVVEPQITPDNNGIVMAGAGAAIMLLILLTLALLWIRRRPQCLRGGKSQPRVRPGEPLLAERYITNPQYGICTLTPGGIPIADVVDADGTTVPLIQRSSLVFLEEVGEGCFGKVHKGLMRINGHESVVAIKVLKENVRNTVEEDFINEVTTMSGFRHQNILTLIGVVHRDELGGPCMVFEYMEWGDLAGVLREGRAGGGPKWRVNAGLQVARGMRYLAGRRFIHRDLAARNCLVGAGLVVKIADFGMSRDVYTCDYYKLSGEKPMPVRWMSPESIVYARFTFESDVWAYGVVLWEIFSGGKQPFYGYNNEQATKLILRGTTLPPPEDCPPYAIELMRSCWKTDPRERIAFEEICEKLEIILAKDSPVRPALPRPPKIPLDSEGYLLPEPPKVPEYLATMPDPDDSDCLDSDDDNECV